MCYITFDMANRMENKPEILESQASHVDNNEDIITIFMCILTKSES